jgi:hypothetical protein
MYSFSGYLEEDNQAFQEMDAAVQRKIAVGDWEMVPGSVGTKKEEDMP